MRAYRRRLECQKQLYRGCGMLQEGFLAQLRSIQPDLCVTAAYGNILPRAFLDIPRHGTLNIHPSLLPRWRGAAPVPRAIEVQRAWKTA